MTELSERAGQPDSFLFLFIWAPLLETPGWDAAIKARRPRRLSKRESGVTSVHQSATISKRSGDSPETPSGLRSVPRPQSSSVHLQGSAHHPLSACQRSAAADGCLGEKQLANWTFSSGEANRLQRAARYAEKKREEEISLVDG